MLLNHSVLANEKMEGQGAVTFPRVNGVRREGEHTLSLISALISILV